MNKLAFTLLFLALLTSSVFSQNPLAIPDTLSGRVLDLTMAPSTVMWYSTPTQTMGFNGDILGPTLLLQKGDSVTINVINNLLETTTVHWHGMHVSPENDGGPHSIITPGATWTTSFEVLDHAATYWYHPHLHEHTNEHVTKGLAGFIIVRDTEEAAITLPRTYGVDDFPIVVQSRDFDAGNQFLVGTAMDTALLVNGTLNPYLDLPEQVVRLRLLNGSSERAYNFGFSDGRFFDMIASDGRIIRVEFVGGRFLYAVSIDSSKGFQLCPADACNLEDAFCPVGEAENAPKFTILDRYENEDLDKYARFLTENDIGVGALEYKQSKDGKRMVYVVNTITNYNSAAETVSGKRRYGMFEIAKYLGDQLKN